MTEMYLSSKGPVRIADMAVFHANAALAKLRREAPERIEEIEALAKHVASFADAPPKGHNNPPPEPEPAKTWDAIKINMDDLLVEVQNWADGVEIANQDQADRITELRENLKQAAAAADLARAAEKKPLDDLIDEIQTRYNEYIAPAKNKKPGKITNATTALNALLTKWLNKLAELKAAQEKAARDEADKARIEALETRRAAQSSGDLSLFDASEGLLEVADAREAEAKRIERAPVQAKGGAARAVGLRSYWTATLIPADADGKNGGGAIALRHYLQTKPERIKEFLQSLADEDVRNGVREIPGFLINEEKRVA